jgi:hypothetical protein
MSEKWYEKAGTVGCVDVRFSIGGRERAIFDSCPYVDPKAASKYVKRLMAKAYGVTDREVKIIKVIPIYREAISDNKLHLYKFRDWLACEFCPWQPYSFGALQFTTIHSYCARDYERERVQHLRKLSHGNNSDQRAASRGI